jgi:dihydrofolate reductase
MAAISLIVAVAENGVIGRENALPWHLPADLKHFKALTLGKPILMGRKTWESIGRLLPGRENIVITRQDGYKGPKELRIVSSLEEGFKLAAQASEVMIIGGAEIYRQALPLADRVYLTRVALSPEGDTLFPPLPPEEWRQTEKEAHPATEKAPAFAFETWERLR